MDELKLTRDAMAGITVLDFTHAAAGPLCTMVLGDFGADVIKIEKPGRGDGSRHMRMTGKYADALIGSDYYLGLNRNKRSVGLDLGTAEGQRLARELAMQADVLVQNFRPGTLDKLGLGYDELARLNPRLIYCNIAAFPPDGPLADEPGMDIVVQARAGTIAMTGFPGGEPVKPGPSLADMSGGLQATIGILMALRARDVSGTGQKVEVSLYDASLLMLANYAAVLLNTDEDIQPMGSGHPQLAPYQAFKARDRWFFIAVGTNGLWRRLCDALAIPEVRDDPLFASNWTRVQNKPALVARLTAVFARQDADHWLGLLQQAGIPASAIVTPREAYQLELAQHSPMVDTVVHPDYGPTHLPGQAIRLDKTPGSTRRYPPRLGDQTNEVLREKLGLSTSEIERLTGRGVVVQYQRRATPAANDE